MLNVEAKEFVPRCGDATSLASAPASSPSAGGCGSGAKTLSVKAPAFVPRAAASDASPTAISQHGSSGSVSSSLCSHGRGAGSDAGGDEQPTVPASAAPEAAAAAYIGTRQGRAGRKGTGTAAALQEEPEQASYYDTYSMYGMYDNADEAYGMAYGATSAACDGGVYYGPHATMYGCSGWDGSYGAGEAAESFDDAYQAQMQAVGYDGAVSYPPYDEASYYWDPVSCSYVYSGEYGSGECAYGEGAWGAAGEAADGPDGAAGADAGCDAVDLSCLGDGLGQLSAPDARELLELFFPHYAGDALARLLERQGSDLASAFAELAAMERQLAAERAPSAVAATPGPAAAGGKRGEEPAAEGGRGARGGRGGKKSGAGAAFKLDLEAFPSLGSPSPTKPAKAAQDAQDGAAAGGQETGGADAPTAAAESAISGAGAEQKAPRPAAAAPSAASPASSPSKPNYAALLRPSASASSETAAQESPQHPKPSRQTTQVKPAHAQQKQAKRGDGGGVAGGAGSAVPWVPTGAAVAGQYAEERAEAGVLARARNTYFMQATMAYLNGNKALAKELGRKGRQANEAMKAAHAAAAARIFAQRNPAAQRGPLQRQQRGRGAAAATGAGSSKAAAAGSARQAEPEAPESLFVDLHGLHAAEAVAVLEAQIAEARSAGYRYLRVCTGTGHHTKGSKTPARLPPAVADTLLANHMTFRTLQPGLLEATL
ncbi:hypothetical protein GPECTOR_36g111 [Gonium pectorale]|uniref:Smr domain-containing protein n=1 Tax=Gonium pectorale TaxID=33097 RepID=A0A150GBQ5_GONPE|nr:hypothetical protein GPECTOR_36g111 [Gonium pectorale]|eukprot:KXZ47258.1 hypothetical protein GPECTOR_36g111 [Gonium pectorale]